MADCRGASRAPLARLLTRFGRGSCVRLAGSDSALLLAGLRWCCAPGRGRSAPRGPPKTGLYDGELFTSARLYRDAPSNIFATNLTWDKSSIRFGCAFFRVVFFFLGYGVVFVLASQYKRWDSECFFGWVSPMLCVRFGTFVADCFQLRL